MIPSCPHCETTSETNPARPKVRRFGYFRRKSDSRWIQRFRCHSCERTFSHATRHPCFGQNKRHVNLPLLKLLCIGVSQRSAAKFLRISRTTLVRKLIFLGERAHLNLEKQNAKEPVAQVVEFDDMETFEHTKCKPLSITLVVESGSRRILGFEVSRMPAKGKLAKVALKKYGPRRDERSKGRKILFKRIQALIAPEALIKSDENPHYPADVKRFFPKARHEAHKGKRGCIVGQGELKKIGFDPLFSLNHTCAMHRAGINRLFRRTWCTTKKPERLALHLAIFAVFHNQQLKAKAA